MSKTFNRWQLASILKALKSRRVTLLVGPRQCGKTTLVKMITGNSIYRTLDNKTLLDAALADPIGFTKHGDELMIIDEIQRAPVLLPAIKMDVDENTKYGRFLLTGSAKIQSLPTVKESLAGRIRKIRLRPLAQGEINNVPPTFLQNAFNENFSKTYSKINKDDCIHMALIGGYPEAIFLSDENEVKQWHYDYLESLIEKDMKDIFNIRRSDSMKNLLHTLAAWSSKYLDISSIASALALSRPTVVAYINALEALYLIERINPWSNTDYSRVGKQDKFFMSDTGLLSSLLNYNFESVRFNGDQNGKLIETFVYNQLAAHLDTINNYTIFHYRDRLKREIDFIIENDKNELLGIEVKAGSAVGIDSFKHLKWFKENIAKGKKFVGIVLYTGDAVLRFGESMWALPISCLWS
jgi:uncharacterized protein